MPPRSRVAILWASIQSFFGCYSPLPQTPHLPPSGTLRGPSQTERGGVQGHALPAVPPGDGGRTRASLASRVAPASARGGGDMRMQELA